MNTINYFISYEETDEDLRADEHEGLDASYLPTSVKILTESGKLIKGIKGKVDSRPMVGNFLNLYCMLAITESDLLNGYKIDERFNKFGNQAVIIDDSALPIFLDRIKRKIVSDENYCSAYPDLKVAGLVDYVNRDENHPYLTAFNKFQKYAWQKEFRIALGREVGEGPLSLYIGDLNGVAKVYKTSTLIECWDNIIHGL